MKKIDLYFIETYISVHLPVFKRVQRSLLLFIFQSQLHTYCILNQSLKLMKHTGLQGNSPDIYHLKSLYTKHRIYHANQSNRNLNNNSLPYITNNSLPYIIILIKMEKKYFCCIICVPSLYIKENISVTKAMLESQPSNYILIVLQ